MEADEAGTLARVKSLRTELLNPKVTEYGGRIVKTTGDGTLIEFPSAVDAVQHAVDVQREIARRGAGEPEAKRIVLRMGINLGDIIIDGDDIYGDGVNVAARLEGLAEPSGICISGTVYEHVRKKLDTTFEDMGAQQVKNIAEPIRVYRVRATPESKVAPVQGAALALPDKPSIAVLPFQNISGDPEQEYFADGMVEEIITGLARIKWLFVIARNSSFAYKGKTPDIRQVGRELGVRYVLEGSVRKAANRVRITGQLIEAETGAHLWADRYDGAIEDVFELQDRITETIVGIIEPNLRLAEIERARRKRPDSLGAYDLYLRALPHFASVMPEEANIGLGYLEEALKLDPNYAAVHAHISWALEIRVMRGGFNEADAAAGVRHARAALAYGSDDATALAVATIALLHLGHDFAAASGAITRALSLNGSCAIALFFGAHIHGLSGDAATAEDYALRAMRLSPYDPFSFLAHLARGCLRLRDGRFDDAASLYFEAVQANPRFSVLHTFQAAALAMAGRVDEAKIAARRVMELEPTFRTGSFVEFLSTFVRPELARPLSAGLRQTGLPE